MHALAEVRNPARYRYEKPRQAEFSNDGGARVEFYSGAHFETALADLAGFDRVWLLFVFHLNLDRGWKVKVRPPVSPDDARIGVFATRSPYRPNPIGLSCVELLGIDGLALKIGPCDLLDGTPVLDVKPYIPAADAFPESAAGWRDRVKSQRWTVELTPVFCEQARFLTDGGEADPENFCRVQLGENPLDRTRKRVERLTSGRYAIGFRTWRIEFEAEEPTKKIRVLAIRSHYREDELVFGAPDRYGDKDLHRAYLVRWPSGGGEK